MSLVSRSSPSEQAAFVELPRQQREQVAELRDEIARLRAALRAVMDAGNDAVAGQVTHYAAVGRIRAIVYDALLKD